VTDVLFSNVPLLRTCIGGLCPSLTFLQLGTYLESLGHAVTIHDVAVDQETRGSAVDDVVHAIADTIVRRAPAVLGLSAKVPADGRYTRSLAREVKRRLPDVTIVLGGIWASPCHRAILERIPEVDCVAIREGEKALGALCDRIERGVDPFGPGSDEVRGMAFRRGGEVVVTEPDPPLTPEDHPPLALELMPSPDSYTVFPYLTSKGCPYRCSFCAERIIYPDHIETSIERLRADVERLEAFGRDYFLWLSDPLFGAKRRRLVAIAEILRSSRFHFLLESRVDVLDPAHLPLLWDAGCDLIYFGLESASLSSLQRTGKIRTAKAHARYLDKARALMAGCMSNDITPVFGVINPVPGDTIDDLRQTYDFLVELADIARETADAAGTDPGYHLYAFDYRFIRGTPDFAALDSIAARGATWAQDPDDVFRDLVVRDASPTVSRSVALELQRKIRALVHTTPKGWERLQRSFPPQPLGGLG
jgi:magnesium-protoporphyrin IX monomethyl ester (oxidative) cyclase